MTAIQYPSDLKVCFKCGTPKSAGEFYAHPQMKDGRLGKCKECCKSDVTNNRIAKVEYYREFDRRRANLPHRVKARQEYQKTPRGRQCLRKCAEAWAARNPRKRTTQIAFGNALRDGKMVKQPCVRCGALEVHGHHENYDLPFVVVWLCPLHHSERHKEMRRDGIIP